MADLYLMTYEHLVLEGVVIRVRVWRHLPSLLTADDPLDDARHSTEYTITKCTINDVTKALR